LGGCTGNEESAPWSADLTHPMSNPGNGDLETK
jgi:hypothetical protein